MSLLFKAITAHLESRGIRVNTIYPTVIVRIQDDYYIRLTDDHKLRVFRVNSDTSTLDESYTFELDPSDPELFTKLCEKLPTALQTVRTGPPHRSPNVAGVVLLGSTT